jgi:hypothetical protein
MTRFMGNIESSGCRLLLESVSMAQVERKSIAFRLHYGISTPYLPCGSHL